MEKYQAYPVVDLPDRQWPSKKIETAPAWCSVDLRDGNQALIHPMSLEQKVKMFKLLVKIGFKEIEVGFPSASDVEYKFCRTLIEENLIPEDVTIQVLTQAREHLIIKTFEALKGAKKAIIHLYNSTSTLQRKVVFGKSQQEIIDLAVEGAELVIKEAAKHPETDFHYEYSPESFTGTELDYALEICEAVIGVIKPTKEKPLIVNLPATVEMSTPNIYADQIEWFGRNISCREAVLISLHAHNDRGCAVAATELAMMAGGDRVEGTLFGNGERTGNVDLVTLGLNLFTQGVDPKIDFSNIDELIKTYEEVTRLPVHPRHPYAGDLVYTAFSGSHQDAINKGMDLYEESKQPLWEVPYLPIDPSDVGRSYESIIRINSQSGKGGVAYIMRQEFGYKLPKAMHPEFGGIVQAVSDKGGEELEYDKINECFQQEYLEKTAPYKLIDFQVVRDLDSENVNVSAVLVFGEKEFYLEGQGNGPLSALCTGFNAKFDKKIRIVDYQQHTLEKGSRSGAAAYVALESDGKVFWGVGVNTDITLAPVEAVISALNRM